jgi:hypothetical protein
MSIEDVVSLIGGLENITLEYKSVLPPSKNIAQTLAAFANTEGGFLVIGVLNNGTIKGLSEDFHATEVTHKAIDLLSPRPNLSYKYLEITGKKVFVIGVDKAIPGPITVEGKVFTRRGATTILSNVTSIQFSQNSYREILSINEKIIHLKNRSTSSKLRLLEHYQNILKLIDQSNVVLNATTPQIAPPSVEGRTLSRMLFSSIVDNFETYLSDLLYEIYLAKPESLKSSTQKVSIEEVLNCTDLQEFVKYWAKQKLSKLQKGSVKGFSEENAQIKELNVLNPERQDRIERILQIRHLYIHRNGVVDDKFKLIFKDETINTEYQMPLQTILDTLTYLIGVVVDLDKAAMNKYNLTEGL